MTELTVVKTQPDAPVRRRNIVVVDKWAYITGLRPIDLKNERAHIPDGLEGQTSRMLANCEALLKGAGMSKSDVVSVRISLAEYPRFYDRMWAVLDGFFPADSAPSLTVVGVTNLERGALIEMDVVAKAS
jgi:2-iminobutanoate/2-iminopropanoate deaminase